MYICFCPYHSMAKRVSTDEKLDKIITFFKKSLDIFSIKELEKKIPKECGISSMLVQDLLKKLADDNLISIEKCGASNIYWCFPYQKHHYYSCETEKTALAIDGFKEEIKKKKEQLSKIRQTKASTPERNELVEEYNKLKKKVSEIEANKKHNEECSMSEYKGYIKEIKETKEKINKLTDDIFTIQGYVKKKYGMERKDFNKSFGIDEDMDYLQ